MEIKRFEIYKITHDLVIPTYDDCTEIADYKIDDPLIITNGEVWVRTHSDEMEKELRDSSFVQVTLEPEFVRMNDKFFQKMDSLED